MVNVSKSMNIFQKLFYVFNNDKNFFKEIKKERFSETLIYLLFVLAIPLVFQTFFVLVGIIPDEKNINYLLRNYVDQFISTFIFVGIFHLLTKLFGGKEGYSQTLKAYVYGFTPSILFSWIPFIGIIGVFYGVYLFVQSLSIIQSISKSKAFLVWLIPILVIIIIFVLAALIVGSMFFDYMNDYYSDKFFG